MNNLDLRRFQLFAAVGDAELRTIARQARVLELPAGRWLLRPRRQLTGCYFLDRGRVRLWSPERELKQRTEAARHAFYPGSSAILTLARVRIVQLDLLPLAFLLQSGAVANPDELPNEPWLQRFLQSPLLQRLDAVRWQHLLRALEPRVVAAGTTIIRQGDRGDAFYVLRSGLARVHRGTRTLARLRPGDFFGEDALIVGAPRNATVSMLAPGTVLRLPRTAFLQLLVRGVVSADADPAVIERARVLNIGRRPVPGSIAIGLGHLRERAPALDRSVPYRVTGGPPRAVALAVFLLLQVGLEATCVVEPVVGGE